MSEISKKVQEIMLNWFGHVMQREELYVDRRAMGMKEQVRRREERLRYRVRDDIREKGLSGEEVYDHATWRRLSSYIDLT